MILTVAPLTAEAFAPYGEVCDLAAVSGRADHVAALHNGRPDARPNLFVARSGTAGLPLRIARMESHPLSSQSFLPLAAGTILVVVAARGPGGAPDMGTSRGFLTRGQGFSYRAGVWHTGVTALGNPLPVVGFMYEDGSPQDCVFADVPPFTVVEA